MQNVMVKTATNSTSERQQREEAVQFALASVELEGFSVSDEYLARARRYIDGEIEISELTQSDQILRGAKA